MASKAWHKEHTYYARNRDRILANRRARYHERKRALYEVEPWRQLINGARARAHRKGLECDLTLDWGERFWTGRCALTSIEFEPSYGLSGGGPRSPSIDRIDNSRGYTQDNCRFVLLAVNSLKSVSTDVEMFEIARVLVAKAAPNDEH